MEGLAYNDLLTGKPVFIKVKLTPAEKFNMMALYRPTKSELENCITCRKPAIYCPKDKNGQRSPRHVCNCFR
jgi:hypothetical protein